MFLSKSHRPGRRLFAAVLCAVAVLGGAQVANAGSIVEASADGGATWTVVAQSTGDVASGSTTVGNFVVTVQTVSSNAPGSPAGAHIFSTTTEVDANGTGGTLLLVYGSNGFTAPQAPPTIVAATSLSGTFNGVAPSVLTNTGYVNQGIVAAGMTGTTGPGAPNTVGAQGVAGDGGTSGIVIGPTGTINLDGLNFTTGTATAVIPLLNGTFALNQEVSITMAGGSVSNLSGNVTLSPEPASMTMLCIGLVGMGGYGFRRWRQGARNGMPVA